MGERKKKGHSAKYVADLNATERFLKKSRTAREVSEKFNVSRFAAYERIQALVREQRVECLGPPKSDPAQTGPRPMLYRAIGG